MLVGAVV